MKLPVSEVVDGVAQEPPGPVDDVDGGGHGGPGGGVVVYLRHTGPGDRGEARAVDEGEAGLDEAGLLGQQPLHGAPGLRVHTRDTHQTGEQRQDHSQTRHLDHPHADLILKNLVFQRFCTR